MCTLRAGLWEVIFRDLILCDVLSVGGALILVHLVQVAFNHGNGLWQVLSEML